MVTQHEIRVASPLVELVSLQREHAGGVDPVKQDERAGGAQVDIDAVVVEASPCEQPIDTLPRFKNVFGTARRFSTSREQRGATRSEQPSRNSIRGSQNFVSESPWTPTTRREWVARELAAKYGDRFLPPESLTS